MTGSPGPEVDVVLDARATLGEGPTWDPDSRSLFWVDILRNLIHRFDPATGEDVAFDAGRPVGALALRVSGGLVLALEDGIALASASGDRVELVAPVGEDDPATRFNDGKCDPAGRFWAGTMAYDEAPGAGALYRFDPDHRVERMLTGVSISNGLAWSLDQRMMYYIDSPTQAVDAFDYDQETGTIDRRRRVVEIPKAMGIPDGMTIDAEGGLWVALWGGWAVHRYRPDGRLDRVVEVPAAHVTSCAFGGPALDDLFVTSAQDGLDEAALAAQPHAGAVFRCRPGVAGVPAHRFAG